MLALQLWFWVTLFNSAGIILLFVAIHSARMRKRTFSLRLLHHEGAMDSHKHAFRTGAALVSVAQAAHAHLASAGS